MRVLSRLQTDPHRDSSQESGVQTLSERTNIAFLAILLIAPLSVLFSRWVIRFIPVGDVVELLTSFGEDRIQSELRRIQVETSDYMYLAIVAFSLLLVFVASGSRSLIHLCLSRSLLAAPLRWVRKNSYLTAVFLISIHFGSLHRWRIGTFGNRFLDGFGAGPTFLSIVIVISATRAETHLNLRHQLRNSRSGNWVLSALAVLILLPQTLTFGRQIGSNREYVIAFNEYAAASSNLRPLRDFSPTYSSLAAFIVSPVVNAVSTNHAMVVLVGFHTIISVILLLTVTWLAKLLLECRWSLAMIATAVLISPRRHGDLTQGFLPSTSAPARFTLPVVFLLILYYVYKCQQPKISHGILAGSVLGVVLVNNAEIGLPLMISSVVAMSFKAVVDRRARGILMGTIFAAPLAFAAILGILADGRLLAALRTWSVFIRGRAVGGYIEAVPVWGIHHFALAIHAAAIVLGALVIHEMKSSTQNLVSSQALLCLTLGLFGFMTFPYYLGQNGPSFVGGLLWLPLILTLFSVIGTLRSIGGHQAAAGSEESKREFRSIFTKPIFFGISVLAICSLIYLPDPQNTLGTHFHDDLPSWDQEEFTSNPEFRELTEILRVTPNHSELAYYGEYGNLFSLLLNIDSVYGTHDPMIAYSSRHTVKATCFPLQIYRPRVVFASKKFLPEQFKEPDSTAVPCPGLQRDHTFRSELLIRYYFKP